MNTNTVQMHYYMHTICMGRIKKKEGILLGQNWFEKLAVHEKKKVSDVLMNKY